MQSHIDSARKNTKGTEKVAPLNKELVAKMVVHDLSKTEQGEEALSCTKSPEMYAHQQEACSLAPKFES